MEEDIFNLISMTGETMVPVPIKTKRVAAKAIEKHVLKFVVWYSGMEKDKVIRAYERFKREVADLDRQRDEYYNRDRLFERNKMK